MHALQRLLPVLLFAVGAPLFAQQGKVTGRLTYAEKIALPPQAEVHIILADVSKSGASGIMIAEKKFTAAQQVPIPFTLTFDKAKIDQEHDYALTARITVDGKLRFLTDKRSPVLTKGKPSNLDLVLKPLGRVVSAH